MRRLFLVVLLLTLAHSPARAGTYDSLGRLEREAADEALSSRGLTVDPAPDGKRIGAVHVVNLDVFSERDRWFQFFNVFHWTTREQAIRRESLLQAGDIYRTPLVEETTRNLQNPTLSSVVVLLPVQANAPDTVDLLIVTRDVWSLRLNTDFSFHAGSLYFFTASLSENNLFGWRKQAAVVYEMDLGQMRIGPTYVDPNVAGTRLVFNAYARAHYERVPGALDSAGSEGASFGASLYYPLYSLASRWGAGVSVSHTDTVARGFVEERLRPVDVLGTPNELSDDLPWIYRYRSSGVGANVTRRFGARVIHDVSLGYGFNVTRPSFMADFPTADPTLRAAFARKIFPRSERLSSVSASHSLFTPNYRVYRDFNTFDLRENFRLGPSASASVSRAAEWLGSDRAYTGLGAGAAWAGDLLDGYQRVGVSWGSQVQRGSLTDQGVSASLFLASPTLKPVGRLIAQGFGSVAWDRTTGGTFVLGGENGLRGYALGDFEGRGAQFVGHVEFRSQPLALSSLRAGGVLFWDVGHAARQVRFLRPHHDFGLGLRLLIPQLNSYVIRLDWAVPTQDTRYTRAGLPGRISGGFEQAF